MCHFTIITRLVTLYLLPVILLILLCAQESSKPKYKVFMLAIPTIFDLIATVLMNIGLLSVTASVYQMMRGAEMFFAAIFSVLFLHRRLNKFHLLGILCCVVRLLFIA